ncbi:hypothetical protein NEOLEDRAFT_8290 [Neolentinus lepideus HHB14362 ss-1]|uniref:Uncharacterized protein n=1 Tax=Neolentinus lepideus HHB14362 ss-1 TaxID=1314782 RepID=A0A165VZ24_9AGAM|nr:hypothetical protein NEOLEDRAFT_8290 [Neolentinus lepideus HHB14362 ss-1]
MCLHKECRKANWPIYDFMERVAWDTNTIEGLRSTRAWANLRRGSLQLPAAILSAALLLATMWMKYQDSLVRHDG